MNNSISNSEKLVRYFDGEMNEQERQEFEKVLREDQQLQNELDNLKLSKEAVHSYGLNQQVKQVHEMMMNEMRSEAPVISISRRRKIIRYTIAVAASIIFIFIGLRITVFTGSSPDKLYNEKYTAFELTSSRSEGPELSAIEKLYEEKKYTEVVSMDKTAQATADEFLIAVSWLELNNPVKAIHCFTAVLEQDKASGQKIYKDEAEYYLALAYLKNTNYDKAIELMNFIHNDPNHLYHEKFSSSFIGKVKRLM